MRSDASSEVAEVDDGRKAFDFLMGSWNVANRRLVDPLRESAGWREFSTVAVARPLLKGLGNTDSYDSADDSDFHGVTLRLFDPAACLWRIWWASTSRPGHLDPPMEGRFDGSRGVFHGTDTVDGTAVGVRFDWNVDGPDRARWSQSISTDAGAHWLVNFTMRFDRAPS